MKPLAPIAPTSMPDLDLVVEQLCAPSSLETVLHHPLHDSPMPSLEELGEIMSRLKATLFPAEETASVDTSVFMASSSRPPQEMLDELEALCRKEFTYKPWRKFILSVLEDEAIRVPLLTAPAAKSVHHAWVGGLLEHTLSVATLCLRFCDHYPVTRVSRR